MMTKHRIFIGDIHSHYPELMSLMSQPLIEGKSMEELLIHYPEKLEVYFLGDYWDRGTFPVQVTEELFRQKANNPNNVFFIKGNHCYKWQRYLNRQNVQLSEEQNLTLEQIKAHYTLLFNNPEKYTNRFLSSAKSFYDSLPTYIKIPDTNLIATHAYFSENSLGSKNKENKFMYGLTTGYDSTTGFPNRTPWWKYYDGRDGKIIFGHIGLDKGTKFGEHAVCVDSAVFRTGVLTAYNATTNTFFTSKGEVHE